MQTKIVVDKALYEGFKAIDKELTLEKLSDYLVESAYAEFPDAMKITAEYKSEDDKHFYFELTTGSVH